MRAQVLLFAALSGLIACQTLATNSDQPARIVDPTAESRAALQQVVNALLNTEVTIADDALTDTSVLIIERSFPRSLEGANAQGRNMELPFQFRLVINGDDCVLIDQRDQSRHELRDTSCVAEE